MDGWIEGIEAIGWNEGGYGKTRQGKAVRPDDPEG